jgi:casein kinase I family protein HRR25
MSTKYNELKNKVIFGKYRLDRIIGMGSFGCVFHGTNIKDNSEVAIKSEIKNFKDHLLELECNFLLLLKGYGIPDVKSYGRSGQFYALVLELLGINLKELKSLKKRLSLKEISLLAIQIIDRIEYVHSKYIVHRDIKPENFLLGYKNSSTIYIIDFGISKKYRSSRTGKHVRFSKTGKMFGTIRYNTYNASRGLEQSRRDDLESIGHMLIYLVKGYLPWANIGGSNVKKRYFRMLNLKKNTSTKTLCQNLPNEFLEYINYCKNLKFEEDPDYEYLRSLFRKILINLNEINDKRFSSFSKNSIAKSKFKPLK